MRYLILALLLVLAGACASTGDGGDRPVLTVASDLDNMPFAGVDADGVPIGRDVAMMEHIADDLGMRLAWRRMPFEELLDAAAAGEVDCVCATTGITPERRRRVDFSTPYYRTGIVVLVRAEDEIADFGDLVGRRVAAGLGTTSFEAVRRWLPRAIGVFENKSGLPTARRLLTGEIDGAVMDGPAAEALAASTLGELRVLPGRLQPENYAIVFPKGSPLKSRVDAILTRDAEWLRRLSADYGL